MEQTLLLNATFEPLSVIHWQRAMTLFYQGKVEIVDEHARTVRAVTFSFRLPSIVRLLRLAKVRRNLAYVPFTRGNIYARDGFRCQYCGVEQKSEDLSFDHVIPQVNGGRKSWENIVTACVDCNRKKGGRTPAEAGMTLRRQPHKPKSAPTLRLTVGVRHAPESWRSYLYWNVELDEDI